MRALRRNMRTFWYCTFESANVEIIDENGNRTGEKVVLYNAPVEMKANISPATGVSNTEQFGNLENYDKVIVFCGDCPVDENSVLFIDHEPEYTSVKSFDIQESTAVLGDDEIVETTYVLPKHDYIVRRVAQSLNGTSIAVSKVKVS